MERVITQIETNYAHTHINEDITAVHKCTEGTFP